MAFFQNSVIHKYLTTLDKQAVDSLYIKFKEYFHNPERQQNIREAKEEQFQEGFLREFFVNIMGYTLYPEPAYNLTTEHKNVKDSKKVDGAIIIDGAVKGVIELKGTDTTDLSKIENQAFGYKNNQPECLYVITSNFEKIRFYIDNAIDHLEFNLFTLSSTEFELLWMCLAYVNIQQNIPKRIKDESISQEDEITKILYKDYSLFKRELHQNLVRMNPQYDPLTLFKKSQKLLDRFLFLFFAEDRILLPPNSVRLVLNDWRDLQERDVEIPLYDRFKKYFEYLNTGYKGKRYDVYAYNGGLFKPDTILDTVKIDDELLFKHTKNLSEYDFASEVDVNILGHIFENSLNELDEITAQLEGLEIDKSKTKRKKDGVFYTPKYITKYIVENTIGRLCTEKKANLQIRDEDYTADRRRQVRTKQVLVDKLKEYRTWLLQLTVCDPACGSGAFLNQTLDFLINEHRYIDELQAKLFGDTLVFSDFNKSILENNLFGVDLNEESVEIAKLSLWLRTAQPNRKLNDLSNNIKCGNSLIDDPSVAGDKAFNWHKAFPQVFGKGGFDVVIGNPPYGALLNEDHVQFFRRNFKTVIGHSEVYYLFTERALQLLIKNEGYISFITPNAWLSNKYASALRKLLITETEIKTLINFNRKIIFEDANVETAIFIIQKIKPQDQFITFVGQDLNQTYQYRQDVWRLNNHFLISFASDPRINEIIKKMNLSEYKLSDKLDISNGFKPYQVGYGVNLNGKPLTVEDVNNRIYHFSSNLDNLYKKEIKGKGIHRYALSWEESYIHWGKWLMSPKSIHYFNQPKILVRQVISDYLYAYLDNDKYCSDQSLYMCTNYKNQEEENLEFYLCLLNSKLYGFYFRKFYSEEDDLFPKVKVNELKNLPVKDIGKENQLLYIKKADLMLSLNGELYEALQTFQRTLKRKFGLKELSKKLEDWYLLPYGEFIKELGKKKVKLSLSEEAEWEGYFLQESQKALEIKEKIDSTDKEIDQMVYELYGLTEDEITIVENS